MWISLWRLPVTLKRRIGDRRIDPLVATPDRLPATAENASRSVRERAIPGLPCRGKPGCYVARKKKKHRLLGSVQSAVCTLVGDGPRLS
jgi:hypothetical protein